MLKGAGKALLIVLLLFSSLAFADRMKWSADLGKDVTGGLIVDGNYIYATTMDTLYKLDVVDGKTIWTLQLKGTLLRPVKAGSTIIVLSKEGSIYVVNEPSKSILKTLNTSGEILNNPLLIAPNLYIPTSKGVQALNTQTNTMSWKQSQECSVQVTPASLGDKLFVPCDNGLVLLVTRSNGVVSDQAKYDDVFWKSSPAAQDSRVILGSFGGKIYGISAKSPKSLLWVKSTADGTSTAADVFASTQEIIVTTVGGKVCSLNGDGSTNWCKDTKSEVAAQPVVTETGIYALSDSGSMYGISHEGEVKWVYDSGFSTKAEIAKKGSMIYLISKNGTVAALSTSSCNINFPEKGDDMAGVEEVEVVVDPYADTQISNVQVRAEGNPWVDAVKTDNTYTGKIPIDAVPMGSSKIECRVISQDGEELPPYSFVDVVRTGTGKKMKVEAPTTVGFGSSFTVKVTDESGQPIDRATVMFGTLKFPDVTGSVKITPPAKGKYRLEVRRTGYVPFRQDVTVGDDYTIIIVLGVLVVLAVAVFYLFYRRWMEE